MVGQQGEPQGGDRDSLRLRPADEDLIRTVVAVMGGSAVIMEEWRDTVPAILMLWYPGMEGGYALADVILGREEPGGRLPCVFPKSEENLPYFDEDVEEIKYGLFHGYRLLQKNGAEPAFPFGFGLGVRGAADKGIQGLQTRRTRTRREQACPAGDPGFPSGLL